MVTSSSNVPEASCTSIANFPGQAVANVILGTENVPILANIFRLVLLHPQQLGQSEVGQRGIAGKFDQMLSAQLLVQPVALRVGALIAPDQRGPQNFAIRVEHDRAVHLPGEADGFNIRRGIAGDFASLCQGAGNGLLRRAPPVFRVLLRPSGLGERNGACSLEAEATTFPYVLTITARVPPVPTSIPNSHTFVLLNRFFKFD